MLLLGPISVTVDAQQSASAVAALVFDGVTVVDVEHGKLVPDQRVVIRDNRIVAVGSAGAVKTPQEAQTIDARGKYLIPGLWDLHVHPLRKTDVAYPLFLANGVTGIRDAGSPVPLDILILWRREILAGVRVGPPRQLLSGPSIRGPDPACDRSVEPDPQTCVADAADARQFVDSLKVAGADMIKPRAVERDLYFVIAAEARRLGLPFGGHALGKHTGAGSVLGEPHDAASASEASDSGARIVDHGAGGELFWNCLTRKQATVAECQPLAERFKRNDTWLVWTAQGSGLPERTLKFWGDSLPPGKWLDTADIASDPWTSDVAQRVGLPIVAGSDTYADDWSSFGLPGFSLHNVLATYVAAGMTPLAALQKATLNAAKLLHATDSLGTVAPGKLADLVLLDADPLADITNTTTIRAVVANGRYFDRAALDGLLAEVRVKAEQTP